ncbi:MAG: hypothetical protein UX39_C0014G0011 [Candidatus Magasanikbacteria bacterium GW2011_GWA2_46_17]|uniref:Uncharacterized protein n=1 Tax=Candidatus Magasanikbacteria bacterium GW2011_GWA2_46_17 TaxID=1619042 RepID=A0A0G1R7F1_9BACT|nr:MAG: hypothetical protein UX39_C0014G0011 [Candidatus Magasanikbacteria bacterium GW2011_GWA2_46_17]
MSLPKIKLSLTASRPYLAWRILSIVLSGVFAGSIIVIVLFIYNNIYTTLADNNVIANLSSNLNMEIVDLNEHERNTNAIVAKKEAAQIPSNIRNIFDYSTSSLYATTTER